MLSVGIVVDDAHGLYAACHHDGRQRQGRSCTLLGSAEAIANAEPRVSFGAPARPRVFTKQLSIAEPRRGEEDPVLTTGLKLQDGGKT